MILPLAPLELEADAEVVLGVPVAGDLLVVVMIVLFGKIPAGVELAEAVELRVTRLAEIVVVEAEVEALTWLTTTVTDELATVVVEKAPLPVVLAARPVMVK